MRDNGKMKTKILVIILIGLFLLYLPAASAEIVNMEIFGNLTAQENESSEESLSEEESISVFEETTLESSEPSTALYKALTVQQKLQELRSVVGRLDVNRKIKRNLLSKLDKASKINNNAMKLALNGKEKQANKMLKSVSKILHAFINEVEAQNGKINAIDAENLIQSANEIINVIEEEDNNDELLSRLEDAINRLNNVTPDTNYVEIENIELEISNVIQELKSKGYNVYLDEEQRAIIVEKPGKSGFRGERLGPVAAYVLEQSAIGALQATGEVRVIEREKGPICNFCKAKIYACDIAQSIVLGLPVRWSLVRLGVDLVGIDFAVGQIADYGFNKFFGEVQDRIGGCDDPNCGFAAPDLVPTFGNTHSNDSDFFVPIDEFDFSAHLNQVYTINATITNEGPADAKHEFKVTLISTRTDNTVPPFQYEDVETRIVDGLKANGTQTSLQFNWIPNSIGNYRFKLIADSDKEVTESDEENNEAEAQVNVLPPGMIKCRFYNVIKYNSTSNPNEACVMDWFYEAEEHLVLLSPSSRIPTFIYITTDPVFNGTGFQAWFPYGAIWQYYSNSSTGPWNACWSDPYVGCKANVTEYNVTHWGYGSGYFKYFRIRMATTPAFWTSGILKTGLAGFAIIENH